MLIDSVNLLSDRVKFKLYAAEQHLQTLEKLQKESGNLAGSGTRISAEIEIDCFLAQIIGAKESFLFQVNQKLRLGIDDEDVDIGIVQTKLNNNGKGNLLKALHKSMRENNWLWLLNDFRNQTVHRNFIRRHVAISVGISDARTSFIYKKYKVKVGNITQEIEKEKVEEVIPYLHKSLVRMKKLIDSIKAQEPDLQ
jgi:hypothetical protein